LIFEDRPRGVKFKKKSALTPEFPDTGVPLTYEKLATEMGLLFDTHNSSAIIVKLGAFRGEKVHFSMGFAI
jgi:hypothetical protein